MVTEKRDFPLRGVGGPCYIKKENAQEILFEYCAIIF